MGADAPAGACTALREICGTALRPGSGARWLGVGRLIATARTELKTLLRKLARAEPTAPPHTHTHRPDLFSRSGALSNREVLEQNVGLPRTQETIDHYANLAGVDFRGAPVEVIEGADDIAYLDFQGAVARTDDLGVQLGPAAFQDEETLVRTLGHESIHVGQYQAGRVSSMTGPLEDEAYAAEDAFVETWRRNTGR